MLNSLKQFLYVMIEPEKVTVRDVGRSRSVSDSALMAILQQGRTRTIVAVGEVARAAASETGAKLVAPFGHPRSLVSDFHSAEHLLKYVHKSVTEKSYFLPAIVVIHPLPDAFGGYTQVEGRAFAELGVSVGGSRVHVWTGRVLTDDEVLNERFPSSGGNLLHSPLIGPP